MILKNQVRAFFVIKVKTSHANLQLIVLNQQQFFSRKLFFTNRVVNIWNSLPEYVVHADTVNCFKSHLDKFWSIQELIHNFRAEICGTRSRSEVVY